MSHDFRMNCSASAGDSGGASCRASELPGSSRLHHALQGFSLNIRGKARWWALEDEV